MSDKFLKAGDPETWEKPEDTSWGDYSLNPNKPLTPKQRKCAELLALGVSRKDIKKELGYSDGWLSRLSTNSKMKEEIERQREKIYEKPIKDRMKELAERATAALEDILDDDQLDTVKKESAARFVIEQLEGKAPQKVEHTGEIGIGMVIEKLEQMHKTGKEIDVTPTQKALPSGESGTEVTPEAEPQDKWENWVEDNI